MFDAMEFCAPELQAQLKGPRIAGARPRRRAAWAKQAWRRPRRCGAAPLPLTACPARPGTLLCAAAKEAEDRQVGLHKKQKMDAEAAAAAAEGGAAAAPADVDMKEAGEGGAADPAADPGVYAGQLTGAPGWGRVAGLRASGRLLKRPHRGGGPPLHTNRTHGPGRGARAGKYELIGVLTHKGRSADSGHYVAWVRQEDRSWVQFDDDKMIPRKEEEVLTLSGEREGLGKEALRSKRGAGTRHRLEMGWFQARPCQKL